MADDTVLNVGAGGDKTRSIQKGGGTGPKTTVVTLDVGGAGAESLIAGAVPVSAAALPLPAGAATEAGHLAAIDTSTARIPPQGQALAAASMPVVLPVAQITPLGQAAMAASVPVTVANNQTAIPTQDAASKVDDAPFTPATDRLLVIGAQADEAAPDAVDEGDAGALRMTLNRGLHSNLRSAAGTEIGTAAAPVRTDPTGSTTQPVSGTVTATGPLTDAQLRASAVPVTANAGTNLNTSALALDATLTGGTQKAIARGGAKGSTAAADLTSTAEGADHQALDVQLMHGGAAKDPTAVRALTNADVVSAEVTKIGGQAPSMGTGVRAAGTQRVTIATDDVVPVTDNGGSLTVDAPVATPVFVRQSDGTTAIPALGTLPAPTAVGMNVRPIGTSQTSGSTALGALNAAATISVEGFASAGAFIGVTNLVGTIIFEVATDAVPTWAAVMACVDGGALATSFVNPVAGTNYTAVLPAGARQLRVRVSAYTSGSGLATAVASATVSTTVTDLARIAGVVPPMSATLGLTVNPNKLDATNDEVATGSSAGQTGALLKNRFVTAATNNAANIKSAPGRLYLIDVGCVAAGVIYVKLYDKATTPAPATDGALLLWVARVIPNVPYLLPFPHGLAFASGLGVAVVTGIGDTDNTPVAAGDAAVNVGYK